MTEKRVPARFYRNEAGNEPVRDWLKNLGKNERYLIGTDIKTVEYGWPIGMPTCKPLGKGLFEVRTNLPDGIARVIFCFYEDQLILLHGFSDILLHQIEDYGVGFLPHNRTFLVTTLTSFSPLI